MVISPALIRLLPVPRIEICPSSVPLLVTLFPFEFVERSEYAPPSIMPLLTIVLFPPKSPPLIQTPVPSLALAPIRPLLITVLPPDMLTPLPILVAVMIVPVLVSLPWYPNSTPSPPKAAVETLMVPELVMVLPKPSSAMPKELAPVRMMLPELVTVLPLPLFTQMPKIFGAVELMVPVLVRVLLSPVV